MRNITNDETNIEERSGNSEKNAIPDFIHDVNMVDGSNVMNSSNNHNSAKRKGAQHTTPLILEKEEGD